ncbi:hypothetical protein F4780DRAFT_773426 [Xylariomycetidae sp. FL0641]|nr:hypothetical protein F4780DRAFT_773426 [Xylariomycetidae sp. FL0641]
MEGSNKTASKIRKRAPKACLSCRARKVRCDVSLRGRPCLNCYLDSEPCVVTGRASRFRRVHCQGQDDAEASFPPYPVNGSGSATQSEELQASENGNDSSHEQRVLDASRQSDDVSNASQEPGSYPPSEDVEVLSMPLPSVPSQQQPSIRSQTPVSLFNTNDITYSYYPFLIISNLHSMMPQDVNYLETQSCLRVPTRTILDEFVHQYFLHVHPLLPLINEGDFWDMYCHASTRVCEEKFSLLVFQSILFSSCNFVSKSSIKALGFPSIRAARATFYRRAKLLFDFDTEESPFRLSQAALLLSYWAPNWSHAAKRPNTAWLGIAIQNAKCAEAHLYSSMPPFSPVSEPIEHRKQNSLKRLWWCCVIRDRILPLGMRRSLQISRAHFDLDSNMGLGYADLADEVGRSKVYSAETKRHLIEIFVQLGELCSVLTDVLMLVFPLNDAPGWGRQFCHEEAAKIKECKVALRRWYNRAVIRFPMFAEHRHNIPGDTSARDKRLQHDSVILYTNLMYMWYHSARAALCHHEVLQLAVASASPNLNSNHREFSNIYENRHELQDATSGVTECLKELVELHLARWLPISAIACTALPLFLHIIDVKLSPQNNHTSSSDPGGQPALKQRRLNILIAAMKTYQPQYDGVDYVSETIRHMIDIAQLDTSSTSASHNRSIQPSIKDWGDILASQPGCYLRLAMTMDFGLSKGRLPKENDFPATLRGLFKASHGLSKALSAPGAHAHGHMHQAQRPWQSSSHKNSRRAMEKKASGVSTSTDTDQNEVEELASEPAEDIFNACSTVPFGYSINMDAAPNDQNTADLALHRGDGFARESWIEEMWETELLNGHGAEHPMGGIFDGDDADTATATALLDALGGSDIGCLA